MLSKTVQGHRDTGNIHRETKLTKNYENNVTHFSEKQNTDTQFEKSRCKIGRRRWLKAVSAAGAMGVLGSTVASAQATAGGSTSSNSKRGGIKLKRGDVILFQGDSVTDAGRKKNPKEGETGNLLGNGYPALAAGQLLADYPDLELKVFNRGVSGNKVPDLDARWQEDAVALQPTVLSIMIGINDLWHTIAFGKKYKATVADYEDGYRKLLMRSQKEIPGVQLVICEPCTLRDWPEFDPYRAVARKLADELELPFVPFHSVFAEAAKAAPTEFWLWDGIHPTPAGHALMLQAWRRTLEI